MSKEIARAEGKNLEWIDAIRGIAILGVVLCHIHAWGIPHRLAMFTVLGGYGVQLFFVASAFTLAKSHDARRVEACPVRNFFIRRFFRIAPLYYAGIVAYGVVNQCVDIPEGWFIAASWTGVLENLFFLHGWDPRYINVVVPGGWSIGVEMGFYLIFPLLILGMRRWWQAALFVLAAWWMAFWAVKWGYEFYHGSPKMLERNGFFYFWLPTQLFVFGFGFLAYAIVRCDLLKAAAHPKIKSLFFLGLSGVLFFGLAWTFWHQGLSIENGLFLAGGVAMCLVLGLALHPWKWLVNRASVTLGKWSFSLYISHFIFVWAAQALVGRMGEPKNLAVSTMGFILCFSAVLAASCALAMLTHRFIEIPGIALGKRLIERLEVRAKAKPNA